MNLTYLAGGNFFGFVVELVNVSSEVLKIRNDELSSEGSWDEDNIINDDSVKKWMPFILNRTITI